LAEGDLDALPAFPQLFDARKGEEMAVDAT